MVSTLSLSEYLNYNDPRFFLLLFHIIWNPLYWNITQTLEFRYKLFSKFWGSRKIGVIIHGCIIFSFGLSRDYLFKCFVDSSPKYDFPIDDKIMDLLGYILYFIGLTFVITSTYRLGIIGTFHGDSYGFLLDHVVTEFPFNICGAPMYVGSTINFTAQAILSRSLVGLFFASFVFLVYQIATVYEDKITADIYSPENIAKLKKSQ